MQDREKFSALHAVGIMALAVRNKVFPHIDPILNVIKSSLPSSRDIHAASKYVLYVHVCMSVRVSICACVLCVCVYVILYFTIHKPQEGTHHYG